MTGYNYKPSLRSFFFVFSIASIIAGVWYVHATLANPEPGAKQDPPAVQAEQAEEEEIVEEITNNDTEEDSESLSLSSQDSATSSEPEKNKVEEAQEEEEEIEQYISVGHPVASLDDYQAGVAVILYANDYKDKEDMRWKLKLLFDRLIELEVNSISLTFPIFQDNVSSTTLKTTAETPKKDELAYFLEKANERGFFTTVRPLIDEKSFTGNDWRGTIRPSDHNAWFESYTSLMVEYAELAEEENADVFSIGVELTSMERHPDHWEEVIEEVREVYSGHITYASNSGISEFMPWDKLDFISVDAFFHLNAPNKNATKKDIIEAWQHWVQKIQDDAERIDKPVVFAEMGTTSQQGSYTHSWRWNHRTLLDMESQRLYYEASCEAWKDNIDGIYWWAVNIWLHEEPENDPGFNPLGKPAEQEIAKCFS